MTPARKIEDAILLLVAEHFPHLRLWRNKPLRGRVESGSFVQAGVIGQADLSGIAGPDGRRIEIEVKADNDALTARQMAWLSMIHAHGGIAFVAMCVEDVTQSLAAYGIYGKAE